MVQVGYGDITAITALEEMTAVFLMLIGASRTHHPSSTTTDSSEATLVALPCSSSLW